MRLCSSATHRRFLLKYCCPVQACIQTCLEASTAEPDEAYHFLQEGCALLRGALDIGGMLLKPGNPQDASFSTVLIPDGPFTAPNTWQVRCLLLRSCLLLFGESTFC